MKHSENNQWLESLITESREGLMRYLVGMSLSVEAAEDIIQEACERLLRASAKGEVTYGQAFLYRTARNLTLNRFRHEKVKQAARPQLELINAEQEHVPSDQVVEARQDLRQVLDAVNSLPPKCRQVFYLRHVEQLTHREIAEKLGVSTGTIEKHLAKGIRLTQTYFKAIQAGEDISDMIREAVS